MDKRLKGRNLIKEIRHEQREERKKRMEADPTYRKLQVKHLDTNEEGLHTA